MKKFEKNNVTIALNVLYTKKEKIYPPYVSKHNSVREKQVILLIIPNGEGCEAKSQGLQGLQRSHYLAVKQLSALLRGITSQRYNDFCCLNYLHSFRTKNKLESHKKVSGNENFLM